MLPFEIISLILLASGASAGPQQRREAAGELSPANGTITSTHAVHVGSTRNPEVIHIESTENGFEIPIQTPTPIDHPVRQSRPYIESTASGWEVESVRYPKPFIQSTASGWEVTNESPQNTPSQNIPSQDIPPQNTQAQNTPAQNTPPQSAPPAIVFTTEVPTLIGIHTEIHSLEAEPGQSQGAPHPLSGLVVKPSPGLVVEPSPGLVVEPSPSAGVQNKSPGNIPTATGPVSAVPQVTSGGDLLTEIISKIGAPQPGAQFSSPAVSTGVSQQFHSQSPDVQSSSPAESAEASQQLQQQSLPGTGAPGEEPTVISKPGSIALPTDVSQQPDQPSPTGTDTPSEDPIPPSNESITIGSATLTLTPGLSTRIGSTLVAITTNTAGQTIIVVSSSGTAVSATMTRTAMTLTRSAPQTNDFYASITEAAKPGVDVGPSRAGGAASAKSTGGVAGKWQWSGEWWMAPVMGVVMAF